MKKLSQIICCAVGAGMIGFFANQLNTVIGCVFFTLVLLCLSVQPFWFQNKIKIMNKLEFDGCY